MKALKIAASKKFEIVEIPEPVSDGENVIIEVSYVGLCGSDVSIWAIAGPFKDIIIGHEYVGRVIDPGSRKDLKKGDLVTGIPQNFCRECEYCKSGQTNLCPETSRKGGPGVTRQGADSRYFAMNPDMAYKLSDKLSDKTAALIEPVATGRHAVKQGNVKKGDKVLIIGGGIISIATAWWAKKAGAEKIVISEINPARLAHLKKNNIGDEVVNFQEEGVFEAVREKMGYGFDVIFECSHPSSDLFNKTIVPLARKGSVVTQVGVILGPLTIDFYPFIIKELHYQACWSYTEDDFKDAIKAVEENQKELEVHITKVISLEEAQQTFEELISGKSNEIKIMIDPKL